MLNSTIINSFNHEVNEINKILCKFKNGEISAKNKNELFMSIINSGYKLTGIDIKNKCRSCNGIGFHYITEKELSTKKCRLCNGSGLKTSPCVRCNGLTLEKILKLRDMFINNKLDENYLNMGYLKHLKIERLSKKFISENAKKTFRVIKASSDLDGDDAVYYYIQKHECISCKGTGIFKHDKIPCPKCKGKKYEYKRLVETGKIKRTFTCSLCNGTGLELFNPVLK